MDLRALKQICPTHYIGDPLICIVHHHGQVIGAAHIAAHENDVAHRLNQVAPFK